MFRRFASNGAGRATRGSARAFSAAAGTASAGRSFTLAAMGIAAGSAAVVYAKSFDGATPQTAQCFWGSAKPQPVKPAFDYDEVRRDITALLEDDLSVGPVLVRLAWHEAGTWDKSSKDGSPNSASMRFHPECAHAANAGLQVARDLLEPVKAKHPKLSYGDLWSLAGCIAIEMMGGDKIEWKWGRKDAQSSAECAPDGRLPDAAQGGDHIRDVFGRMGFDDRETVALIGAHAVGECHADRSGFVGPWTHDKLGFGNFFFTELVGNDWILNKEAKKLQYKDAATGNLMMLPADVALLYDAGYKKWVEAYAASNDQFNKDFAKAFQKLMELGCPDLYLPA